MTVEYAQLTDTAQLTELRLEYLKEDIGEINEDDINSIKKELPVYFRNNLNKSIFCYIIKDGIQIVSCAFLLIVEKPLSPAFMTGKTGMVLNVYTKPLFRRMGYAKTIMQKLLSDAAEKGLSVVELKATDDGYNLYKSVGFKDEISNYHYMKWHI